VTAAEGLNELDALGPLVSPFGPVAAATPVATTPRGLGRLTIVGAMVGSASPGHPLRDSGLKAVTTGGGRAVDNKRLATLVAIAEGAERYAGGDFLGEYRVLARACELDGPVLDLDRIPRCSERELSHPGCRLRALDPSAPLRWVQGTDLITGQRTWVPAVMACYGLRDVLPSERFWGRISTGFAVHSNPLEALVGAICEVIERDLHAVSWLQRLPLPVIASQYLSPAAHYLLDWSERHFIETFLFDGTSDMGVPTAYCLQIAEHDDRARHAVGAGTTRDIRGAAEKALLEALGVRHVLSSGTDIEEDFSKFSDIADGARYMGRPEMAPAFSFLVDGARGRPAPERPSLPDDPADALAWLLDTLSRKGMQAIAVDRTPRELRAAGLTPVNVVIPDLQPMSLYPLSQCRAHPRLYQAPLLMGYPSHSEEDLNPWPQPFQ
jgi:ribosomal protein S12 methylthiotransferase accessory factor